MKKIKRFLIWTLALLLITSLMAVVAGFTLRTALGPAVEVSPPRAVYAPQGVVATSQPLASQAGLTVLKRGGNAVDAAVTAAVVLNVVEPYMSGLGGDLFAIMWSAEEERLIGINASGRSGSLMTRAALSENERVPREGPKSITVPGALSGWVALLEQYGTTTLAEAFEPAIALAEKGFPISDVTASEWAVFVDQLKVNPGASATFLFEGERGPEVGEWHSNPDFAKTCLLYTSPSPRDGLLSRMPSSA